MMPLMPDADFDLCRTCGAWRSAHKAGLQDLLTAHDFAEPLMPEPDFDQIARRLLGEPETIMPVRSMQDVRKEIVEQLRQVWNARGAADLQLLFAASDVDEGLTRLELRGLRNDMRTLDR